MSSFDQKTGEIVHKTTSTLQPTEDELARQEEERKRRERLKLIVPTKLATDQDIAAATALLDNLPANDATRLKFALQTGAKQDPAAEREIYQISRHYKDKLPMPVVRKNLDQLRVLSKGRDAAATAEELIGATEGMRRYVMEHENPGMIIDDLAEMSYMQRIIRHPYYSAKAGQWDVALSGASLALMAADVFGEGSPDLEKGIDALKYYYTNRYYGQNESTGALGLFERGLSGAARMAPFMAATATASAAGGVGGFLVAGPAGVPWGAAAGGFMMTSAVETGFAYDQLRRYTDDNGERLDPKWAAAFSVMAGTVNGALELVGTGYTLKLALGKGTISRLLTGGIERALVRRSFRTAVKEVFKDYATALIVEPGTEMAQELMPILAGLAAQRFQGGEWTEEQARTEWSSIIDVGIQTWEAMLVGGIGLGGARAIPTVREAQRTNRTLEKLEQMAQSAERMKLTDVPQEFDAMYQALSSERGSPKSMFFDIEEWDKTWVEATNDPKAGRDAAQRVLGDTSQYDRAKGLGADLVVPVEKYLRIIAPTKEVHGLLSKHARFAQYDLSHKEQESLLKRRNDELNSVIESARALDYEQLTDEDREVYDKMLAEEKELGRDGKTAEMVAKLHTASMSAEAKKTGETVQETQARYEARGSTQEVDLNQPIDTQAPYVRHLVKQIPGYDEWRKIADERLERTLATTWVAANPEAQTEAKRVWGSGGTAAQFYQHLSQTRGEQYANAMFRRAGIEISETAPAPPVQAEEWYNPAIINALIERAKRQGMDEIATRLEEHRDAVIEITDKGATEHAPLDYEEWGDVVTEITRGDPYGAAATMVPGSTEFRERTAVYVGSDAFQKWFEGSVVKDADGNPLLVFHGTPGAEGFTEFDRSKASQYDPDVPVVGFHFTSRESSAESAGRFPYGRPNSADATVIPVFLSIKNPATRSDVAREAGKGGSRQEITDRLKAQGFDGVVMSRVPQISKEDRARLDSGEKVYFAPGKWLEKDENGGIDYFTDSVGHVTGYSSVDDFLGQQEDHYVAFDATQIKSPANQGTYDPADPNILREGGAQYSATLTPAFMRWFGESKVVDENGEPMVVYHGTPGVVIEEFTPTASERGMGFLGASRPVLSPTFFFSESPYMAREFGANRAKYPQDARLMKVYLSIKNPLDLTGDATKVIRTLKKLGLRDKYGDPLTKSNAWEAFDDPVMLEKVRHAGYDGAIVSERVSAKMFGEEKNPKALRTWVAFEPTQVKSAIGNQGTYDPSDPSILREDELGYQGDTSRQDAEALKWKPERNKNGVGFKGAPEDVKTEADLAEMFDLLRKLTEEGVTGRYWYEESSRKILALVRGNVAEAEKFMQLLAIYSPRTNVEVNTGTAIRVYNFAKSGGNRKDLRGGTEDRNEKARALLYDNKAFDGRKTNSFYLNLMFHLQSLVSPAEWQSLGLSRDLEDKIHKVVTSDLWVFRAFGYGIAAAGDDLGGGKYSFSEKSLQFVAARLNQGVSVGEQWLPMQVQAALWTAIKARHELPSVVEKTKAESVAAGYSKYVKGKWQTPTEKVKKRKHAKLWRTNALAADPAEVAKAVEGASASFATNIERTTNIVPWEFDPSPDLKHDISSASAEVKAEFAREADALVRDDEGSNLLAIKFGLPLSSDVAGEGSFEGKINTNTITRLVPTKKEGFRTEDVVGYAWGIQTIFRQKVVPFLRADYKADFTKDFAVYKKQPTLVDKAVKAVTKKRNALKRFDTQSEAQAFIDKQKDPSKYEIGGGKFARGKLFAFKSLNPTKTKAFFTVLQRYLPETGDFTKISANEIVVVNFRDDETGVPFMDDTAFLAALRDLEETHGQELGITESVWFGSEGKYGPVQDWVADPSGRTLKAPQSAARSPDLLAWVRDRHDAAGRLLERYSGDQLRERERELREARNVARTPRRSIDVRRRAAEKRREEISRGAIVQEPVGIISEEDARARAKGASVQLSLFPDPVQTTAGEMGRPGIPGARGVHLLAKAVPAGLDARGRIDLVGTPIGSPEELAYVARVLRDPRFETLRVFWVKDGKIVAQEAVTSRMPGLTSLVESGIPVDRVYSRAARRAKRLGVDGYYLLHNHPSGRTTPSMEDIQSTGNHVMRLLYHGLEELRNEPGLSDDIARDILTVLGARDTEARRPAPWGTPRSNQQVQRISNAFGARGTREGKALMRLRQHLPQFLSHVIIDHDTYANIAPGDQNETGWESGQSSPGEIKVSSFVPIGQLVGTVDPLKAPELQHPILGGVVNNTDVLANIGRQLQSATPGHVTVIYTSSQHEIVAAEEVPESLYTAPEAFDKHVAKNQTAFGGRFVFAYFTNPKMNAATKAHVTAGVLMDAVLDRHRGHRGVVGFFVGEGPVSDRENALVMANAFRVMEDASEDAEYNAGLRALAIQDELTSEEADEYAALRLELAKRKQAELRQTYLEQQKEKAEDRYQKEVERIREEVADEMADHPHWMAALYFQKGQVHGQESLPAGLANPSGQPWKMSRDELVTRYGPDILFDLRTGSGGKTRSVGKTRPAPYSDTGTEDLDGLAVIFGFSGAEDMVEALAASERYDDAYEARVKTRVDGELGNIQDPDQLAQAALDAAAGPEAVDQILVDLRFLNRILVRRGDERRQPVSKTDLRDKAKAEIQRTRAGLILPYVHERTASKHGRLAFQASDRGDLATAYTERLRQLWQLALFSQAKKGADRVKSVRKLTKRLRGKNAQKTLGKAGTDYYLRVNELLDRYDMRDISNKALKRNPLPIEGENLEQWAERMYNEEGRTIVVDERLITEAARKKTWKELTLSELEGFRETLESLVHNAYTKVRLTADRDAREWKDIIGELKAAIEGYGPVLPGVNLVDPILREGGVLRKIGLIGKSFVDSNLKVEEFVRRLDKDDVRGPWNTYLFEPVSKAQGFKADLMMENAVELRKAFEALPAAYRRRLFKETKEIKALGQPVTRAFMIMVAVNTGTEGNWQRLDEGKRRSNPQWGPIAVREILSYLPREDWEFVVQMWTVFKKLGDLTDELERRDSGVPLKRVKLTPRKQDLPDGTTIDLPGGYFPIIYDPLESGVGEKQLTDDTSGKVLQYGSRVTTAQGRTKERVKEFHDPLYLNLDLMPSKILEAVHDISHRETVRQIDRILRDPDIRHAMLTRLGQSGREQFTSWLEFIAQGRETTTQDDKRLEKFAALVRGNIVYAQLGHKVSIWTQNAANVFNLWDLGKTKYNILGVKRFGLPFTRQQREEMEWVHSMSPEMRHRFNNFERDFRKEFVTLRQKRDPNTRAKEHAFMMMVFTDRMTAYPAWIGAYEQTLDGKTPIVGTGRFLPGGDKDVARMYADRRVRLTLTAAGPKDLARIMRGPEWFKSYTIYMTWFSGVANRHAALKWDVKESLKNKRRAEAFHIAVVRAMAIAIMPAISSELLSGRGPDDDEEWYWWALRKAVFYPLSSMPFVRDLARGAEAAITGESVYGRGMTTPIGTMLEAVGKAGHEFVGAGAATLSDEFELDKKALAKAATKAAGVVFGFPSSQTDITLGYWYDVFIEGSEDPEGVFEFIQKSAYRRPPANKRKKQGGVE